MFRNRQTSTNLSYNNKQISLCIPSHILDSFDDLVKSNGVSRTSKIIELLKFYIKQQIDEIDGLIDFRNKMNSLKEDNYQKVEKRLKRELINEVREQNEPPMIPNSNDYDWEDRLKNLG